MHFLRGAAMIAFSMILAACADPVARKADVLMEDIYAQGGFTGAVVIAKDGKIVYERGFGKADAVRSFTPETASESGSLAKPVTATAILLLSSEGKIDLDAPAQTYVAEFPYPEITVRQLLSHSAGLPDYDVFEDLISGGAPTDNFSLLKALGERRPAPAFAPNSAYEYCNLCYDTLAAIVERVSGVSYADFIDARLFKPAGFENTYVRPAKISDWPGPRALGYKLRKAGAEENDIFDNEGFHGGGNVNFSARDLAKWASQWAIGEAISDSVRLKAVEPARVAGKDSNISLGGWYCAANRTQCYYSGHHQGFHGLSYWDSDRKIAVAFISNNTLTSPLQPALARALVIIAEGRSAGALIYDEAEEANEVDATALAGDYHGDGVGDFSINIDGAWAFLTTAGAPRYRLYPIGFYGLYAPGADVYLFADPSTKKVTWSTTFLEAEATRR